MKKTVLLFTLVSVILMFVSCTSHYEEEINEVMEQQSVPLTRASDSLQDDGDYNVDSRLLAKYLRLSGKSMRQHSVIPLVEDGDTLAYCIQYEDGWDIISGDKRCAPVMITSDSGICNIHDYDIQGLLDYIKDIKHSNTGEVISTWGFLSNEKGSDSTTPITRAGGSPESFTVGMWRAIDTVLVDEVTQIPHIIQAFWSQSSPWNMFTPYINGQKSSVGCSVVAAGQIIHHFRKNNAMGVVFPVEAEADNGSSNYNVDNMNALRWSTMALSMMDENYDQTALMLGYLGQEIMDVVYGIGSTGISVGGVEEAFDWGQLDYDEYNGYDWDAIHYSLLEGSPVCVYTKMKIEPNTNKHVYIIDRYRKEETYYAINCWWDPDYVVSEEEYYSHDPERFIETASGDKEKEFVQSRIVYTYWGMNWGYANSSYDSRFYMSRSYNQGGRDEAGIIPSSDHINATFWDTPIGQTGDVQKIFYNFENKLN